MQRDASVKSTKKEEAESSTEVPKPSVIKRWANLRNVVQVTGTHVEPSSPHKKTRNQRDSFIERFSVQRRLSQSSPTRQPEQPLKHPDTKTDGDDTVSVEATDNNSNACLQKKQSIGESVCGAQDEKEEESKVGVQPCSKKKSKGPTAQSSVPLDLLESQEKIRSKRICANPCWFQPHGKRLLAWLTLLSLSVLYNLWFIIARQAFTDFQTRYLGCWIAVDLCADTIYALDIVVQMGTTYLEHGLVVFDRRKLAMKYVHTKYFVLDILSLLPLDFLQFEVGVQPILRFPRFIKTYRAIQWKDKIENRSTFPNLWRVIILIHILFLGCHWFACIYYIISAQQGFSTEWGYVMTNDSAVTTGRTYLITFYWATLALTTIGIEVPPTTVVEYIFSCLSYLIGLFVFATVVGQVGNIINTRNAARVEFEEILDGVKSYMRVHSVRPELQKRILRWYDYAWQKRKGSGVNDINALEILPDKLKTELALDVNLETLKKVTIFKECRPEFLHDLVLKMRPHIFTPGDYICRKGEIARELFIIADGVLEVVGPNNEVWSRMRSGDFFGEIGVLNIDGQNKQDVLDALQDHPEAEMYMMISARKRLYGGKVASKKSSLQSVKDESGDAAGPSTSSSQIPSEPEVAESSTKFSFQNVAQKLTENLQADSSTSHVQTLLNNFEQTLRSVVTEIVQTYEKEINQLKEKNKMEQ
ncbi:hypothetical protein PHET_04852 [Paragonimus heterotremus]|uniref:Cyclic nucleotide-binding domain-containing protein n=1 Tax=Paragonimus heterotremus TaxID=100268 RepID=A0A8J4SMI1_9TREM|nr:hypothetical protein PHET_04852 [Paragonimus heterotremus]